MTAFKSPSTPPDEFLSLAEGLRKAVSDFVRAARAGSNTPTTARFETLALLDAGNAMSTAKLAERRNVRHQSMRMVIEQLEREGLIAKQPDPKDRRSQFVTLTLLGRETLIGDRLSRAAWVAQALREHVTAEERQILKGAIAVLKRIAQTHEVRVPRESGKIVTMALLPKVLS
jgi:DNA-binding MarR family transcriptional regulator